MQTDQVVSTDIVTDGPIHSSGREQALGFWKEVSRMWPKKWWSPRAHWRDLQLRRYAAKKLKSLLSRVVLAAAVSSLLSSPSRAITSLTVAFAPVVSTGPAVPSGTGNFMDFHS